MTHNKSPIQNPFLAFCILSRFGGRAGAWQKNSSERIWKTGRKLGGEGDRFPHGRQDRGAREGTIGGNGPAGTDRVPKFGVSAYLEFRARISYSCYHGRSGVGASWVEGAGGAAAVERAAAATPQPWWHPVIEPRAL